MSKCIKCGSKDAYNYTINNGMCDPCIEGTLENIQDDNVAKEGRIKELDTLNTSLISENIILDGRVKTRDDKIAGLEAELEKQAYVLKQFGEWYSDNGCPATETKEGFCPDVDGCRAEHNKRNLEEAEGDRFDFDSFDCETQINCGKCYAAYYAKQWDDKPREQSND